MNNNQNPSDRTYNLDFEGNPVPNPPQRRPVQGQPPQGQRRPLTDEERRRLAAARAAGMRMNNGAGQNTSTMPRPNPNGQRPAGNGAARPNGAGAGRPNSNYPPQNYNGQRVPNPNGQRRPNPVPPEPAVGRRRKRKVRINAGAVIFVLLIGTVVGVSAYQISRHPETTDDAVTPPGMESIIQDAQNNAEVSENLALPDAETSGETAEESVPAGQPSAVAVQNSTINEGDLVLVNFEYAYNDKVDDVTLMNAYNERTGKIKVSSTTLGMIPEAFAALEELVIGLVDDTGCDDLLLYSGHRTIADQQRIWDSNLTNYGEEYTKTYVAVPGHSEHHTGLACDLGFYTDDGFSIPLVDHEYGSWVWDHCTEYGYILRYPEDKANLTGIGHEQWHFRYVGLPHAYAVDALDLCLEEYLDELKNYTPDTKLLHISADRDLTEVTADDLANVSGGWLTYYVPASEGETTEIAIPQIANYAEHEISGNNVDGFIVTVTLN